MKEASTPSLYETSSSKDTTVSGLHKAFIGLSLSLIFIGLTIADVRAEEPECASCDRIKLDHPDAVIGEIRIIHKDIFESEDELPAHFPWRTVNRFHVNTKEWVIRRELLFEEGDQLNPDLVREVLRNLRGVDFFRDERIDCSLLQTGKVRIDVYLRENWSLIPIFQIQGVDTAQAVTLGATEQNLLGRGKRLSAWGRKGAEAKNTFIEDSWGVRYIDPNIMGSWYRFDGTIQDMETGEFLQAVAERPFYSLETPWSASLFGEHFRPKQITHFI